MLSNLFGIIILLLAVSSEAQDLRTPSSFRLVTPRGPGSVTVSAADGWIPVRFALYDSGTRAVVQLSNKTLGLEVSYMLWNDESFNFNKESCRNDTLGSILAGPLRSAKLTNKRNEDRILIRGRKIEVGSYLIEKDKSFPISQQNTFGFAAENHTCAIIHVSRANYQSSDAALVNSLIDRFEFDLAYSPTQNDYKLMAGLLPPDRAAAYAVRP